MYDEMCDDICYEPYFPGIWEYEDSDGTWHYVGATYEEYVKAAGALRSSHDNQLWLIDGGAKHWFICDGANPLEADRVEPFKTFLLKCFPWS